MTRIPDYPHRKNPLTPLTDVYRGDPQEIPPFQLRTWMAVVVGLFLVVITAAFLLNITSTGAGPDHQCQVELYEDHSWRPLGWTTRDNWPPVGCNFVVVIDDDAHVR